MKSEIFWVIDIAISFIFADLIVANPPLAVSGALYVIAALADGLSEGTVIPHPQLSKPISIILYVLDLQGDLRRMWSEPFIAQQPSKQLEV